MLYEVITELGIEPPDLRYIVLTHIHMDHAGGAGVLARACPNARVIVHESGIRFLTDPAKFRITSYNVCYTKLLRVSGPIRSGGAGCLDILWNQRYAAVATLCSVSRCSLKAAPGAHSVIFRWIRQGGT